MNKFKNKWTELGLEIYRISDEKFFKKPKAVRERWLSHINPSIIKYINTKFRKEWDVKEDLILFEKIEEFGKKWAKISKVLANKS